MPQCHSDAEWEGRMLDLALATLESTLRAYRTDPDRVVLTGLSMGGFGTWRLARISHHPYSKGPSSLA
jgi:predicted peptidase